MSEWVEKPLSQLAKFQKGRKVKTSGYPQAGYDAYLGASSLEEGNVEGYALTDTAVMAEPNDVMMLWDGERSGLVGHNLRGVVSSTVQKLTPSKEITGTFLYYHLLFRFDWIQGRRTGTGIPHVPKDLARILNVKYPLNIIEQESITSVLSSIDTAIEKTESLIAKYQQIKAGMMHDLFTRGVSDDGKLRPPREQAPELYQETPIGWIPKEWDCKPLEELLAPVGNNLRSGPFGSALLKHELVEDGIPFLGIDNIHAEHFEAAFRRFVSLKKFMELNRYSVRPKDVVITIMGTVGRCCVLPDNIDEALSSKHLWTMTFDQSQVIPELVCWQLNFAPWVLSRFKRASQGAVMDSIQSSTLRSLKLPVPPDTEQKEIFKKYSVCNSKIKTEQQALAKLRKEKLGLIHDLLTGKVRVNATLKLS